MMKIIVLLMKNMIKLKLKKKFTKKMIQFGSTYLNIFNFR